MTTGAKFAFNPRKLGEFVGAATLERGLSLFRGQRVLDMDLRAIDHGRWQLNGCVQGSQRSPYLQQIRLHINAKNELTHWDASCTCPVGVDCKHAVAVSLQAGYKGSSLAEAKPVKPPTEAELIAARLATEQRARDVAQSSFSHWLGQLEAADRRPETDHGDPHAEQFVYILTPAPTYGREHPVPRLQLQLCKSYLKKTGGWGKPKNVTSPPMPGQTLFDSVSPAERELLRLLKGLAAGSESYNYANTHSALPLGTAGLLALEMASDTGRLFSLADGGVLGVPLRWAAPLGLGWSWREAAERLGGEPAWILQPTLASDTAQLYANQPPLYLDLASGACGLARSEGIAPEQLSLLLNAPPMPQSAIEPLQLPLLRHLAGVALPPTLKPLPTIQGVVPTGHLHITRAPKELASVYGLLLAHLSFDYAGIRGSWPASEASVVVQHRGVRSLLVRDRAAERALNDRLETYGLLGSHQTGYHRPGAQSQMPWLEWMADDFKVFRAEGFSVTIDDSLADWLQRADALDVHLEAHGTGAADAADTSPWFDLSLGMEINGERHNILPWLPSLLAQMANPFVGEARAEHPMPPFVYLQRNDGFIRVPTEPLRPWLTALLELVGDRPQDLDGDSLRLSRMEALRAGAALGEGTAWTGPAALQELVAQLAGRSALPEVPLPEGVIASLRPYQQQGLNWLQFLRRAGLNGVLADDMGLGKTLQTLAHIQVEKDAGRLNRPALIIAPVSLMGNWQREAQRFCPGLRTLVLHGQDRHDAAGTTHDHDVVIAPYSLLQRDREGWLQAPWHLVVLDEAQNIKNASTQAARVVGELDTRHRLALSGTPMENHLGEIWSLFHFLMPGFLGSQAKFKERFRTPIEKHGDPERLAQLRSRIAPFMLRRTKALVADELPPKVETIMRVELAGPQADLYEAIRLTTEKAVREALDSKGLAKSHITILDALLKLRQVCCDPQLLKLESAQAVKQSAKLEQLMEILPEMLAEGRRVLLFSQFTSMLTRIEAELKIRGIRWVKLTGQSQKRDQIIDQFTSGAVPLFLISLKAGGVGLNLPQADTVIHYDPWWNPAVETQATDRAHRIGQTQSLWVVKLVAQGTIEERILALQERKAALADSMYGGANARQEPLFSENDLAELLKPL
jgi:superfamily II DNA or RNA helicase